MNEDEILSLVEAFGDLLKEGVRDYRKYSDIGKLAYLRSLSDSDLFQALDTFCSRDNVRLASLAIQVIEERYPGFLDTLEGYYLDTDD